MEMNYRETVDAKRILQIRSICRDLPQACGDYLNTISNTAATFTRLAYAIDLRTFFEYLHAERVAFADKKITLYTDQDLAALTVYDLNAYTEYLRFYLKTVSEDQDTGLPEIQKAVQNHELSIKRKLCSVRAFYDFLFRAQRIPSNVAELVPLPKIHEKPIIRLNQEEMQKMLEMAETGTGLTSRQQKFHQLTARRDYALLMLFLGTGMRVSECVGINLSDIDLEQNGVLVTRKGGNQMVLYYPPEVAAALAAYLEERKQVEPLPGHEEAFFLSIQRRRMTQRAVQLLVKKYAAVAAPLKHRISPHKLRSTYATNLYQETGDIYLVADVLGHSSVDTTRKHYADMTDARRRSAADHVFLTKESRSEANTLRDGGSSRDSKDN